MINRRGFLGVCGAIVGAAVLPTESESVAVAKKASCCDYKLTTSRYVKPGTYGSWVRPTRGVTGSLIKMNPHNISVSEISDYVRPGVYLGHVEKRNLTA
jgi:hypothetical protein